MVLEYLGGEEVYIVIDEATDDRYVFTDLEEAREANNEGGWRRRSLKPAVIDPDESRWSLDE